VKILALELLAHLFCLDRLDTSLLAPTSHNVALTHTLHAPLLVTPGQVRQPRLIDLGSHGEAVNTQSLALASHVLDGKIEALLG
jgi:hypothetical protein